MSGIWGRGKGLDLIEQRLAARLGIRASAFDAAEAVKRSGLNMQPAASPRLRGEVGICASARRSRVRGSGACPNCGTLCNFQKAPQPAPLPASGARENSAALIQTTPDFFTCSKAG